MVKNNAATYIPKSSDDGTSISDDQLRDLTDVAMCHGHSTRIIRGNRQHQNLIMASNTCATKTPRLGSNFLRKLKDAEHRAFDLGRRFAHQPSGLN